MLIQHSHPLVKDESINHHFDLKINSLVIMAKIMATIIRINSNTVYSKLNDVTR